MFSESNTIPDSNEPFYPGLASLPTVAASHEMAGRYITVASLAMFVWENLINIDNDCNLLYHRYRFPTFVFFISRFCCLGFLISVTIIRIAPIHSSATCLKLGRFVAVFYCAVIVFTSLLFFIRTRAIFQRNLWVVTFFAGLWLAVLGACLAFIIHILEKQILHPSNTTICHTSGVNPFVAATTIIPLINDTLVFLATTWRLSRNSYDPYTLRSGIRIFIFGDYLPVFSKVMLQDGQAYYLTIVTMNIISTTIIFIPSEASAFRTVFAIPNVALMNIMACRVFRNTILFATEGEAEISSIQI